eukprot:SAG31_NODE_23342_length_506_cov_0.889435_1_plen_26_part_10
MEALENAWLFLVLVNAICLRRLKPEW